MTRLSFFGEILQKVHSACKMEKEKLSKKEPTMPTIQEINRELADKIVAEAQQNPQTYPRKYVGIANGQVIVLADDLDELDRRLDEVEPDSTKTFIVEPALDVNKVHEIWRSC